MFFAIASLFVRKATFYVPTDNFLIAAAVTLFATLVVQSLITFVYLFRGKVGAYKSVFKEWRLSSLVGFLSAAGSAAWFSAFALQTASYVKAVGQIEVLAALFISRGFFRERTTLWEMAAMGLVIAGILLLVLA